MVMAHGKFRQDEATVVLSRGRARKSGFELLGGDGGLLYNRATGIGYGAANRPGNLLCRSRNAAHADDQRNASEDK